MRFRASFFSICQKFKVVTSAIVGVLCCRALRVPAQVSNPTLARLG